MKQTKMILTFDINGAETDEDFKELARIAVGRFMNFEFKIISLGHGELILRDASIEYPLTKLEDLLSQLQKNLESDDLVE